MHFFGLGRLCKSYCLAVVLETDNLLFYSQIWDFNLGRSRDRNESSALEIGLGTSSGGFSIKSYNDLLNENSFAMSNVLEDIYDPSCPPANEDLFSSNMRHISPQNVSDFSMYLVFMLLSTNSHHSIIFEENTYF